MHLSCQEVTGVERGKNVSVIVHPQVILSSGQPPQSRAMGLFRPCICPGGLTQISLPKAAAHPRLFLSKIDPFLVALACAQSQIFLFPMGEQRVSLVQGDLEPGRTQPGEALSAGAGGGGEGQRAGGAANTRGTV